MESIIQIRQTMAESKFLEAQRTIEALLANPNLEARPELLKLYVQCLEEQRKHLPTEVLLETVELLWKTEPDFASELLSRIKDPEHLIYRRTLLLRIHLSARKGRVEELYELISEFQLYLFSIRAPSVPTSIQEHIEKFFRHDFKLRLQQVALLLILQDVAGAEMHFRQLILDCHERSSRKGLVAKLHSIVEVLAANEGINHLEIYKTLCTLIVAGTREKQDYKKLAELIIYFEDFKFQVILLRILRNAGQTEIAALFAEVVRNHEDFDFVYLDKFFPELKSFFVQRSAAALPERESLDPSDLALEEKTPVSEAPDDEVEHVDQENVLIQTFKYQEYSSRELCEIAVSFLQSEFPVVALRASQLALQKASDNTEYLRASYLAITCMLMLHDYRGALDHALTSLGKAQTESDVLSFMYSKAEAYQKLGNTREAIRVLNDIMKINADYRLTRARLEKLNAI